VAGYLVDIAMDVVEQRVEMGEIGLRWCTEHHMTFGRTLYKMERSTVKQLGPEPDGQAI
jgi:hypothetical protein